MKKTNHQSVSWRKLVLTGLLWLSIILFLGMFVRFISVQYEQQSTIIQTQSNAHDFTLPEIHGRLPDNLPAASVDSLQLFSTARQSKPNPFLIFPVTNNVPHAPKQKIAYIFAGSARSFVCPKVHWSLKLNVLDAFGGEAYSFVRISTEDNHNVRTGKGVIFSPQYEDTDITEALKLLNPRTVEYFYLKNEEEEMKKYYPGVAHRVFRENDRRRYSMFFNRVMGYRLVLDYEKKNNMKFDWVVLIRLDAAWAAPVNPIEDYSKDRVWLTETGYVAYNDQFMLIPRQYSDYLFSLDTKVDQRVYCLGGPDVEVKWKCNATALTSRGVSPQKINETLAYCCPDVFAANVLGFSETIHYRHFYYGNISVGLGKFLVYITRYTNNECRPDCDRLMYNFKNFAFHVVQRKYPFFSKMNGMDSRGSVLSLADTGQCYVEIQKDSTLWNPMTAAEYHKGVSQGLYKPFDYKKTFYEQLDIVPKSLLFFPNDFSPWFIHPTHNVEGCFTFIADGKPSKFSWDDCIYHIRRKGGFRHHPSQTWFVSVIPHAPTRTNTVFRNHQDSFLTKTGGRSMNITRILMANREDNGYLFMGKTTCLSMNTEKKTVDFVPCVNSYEKDPNQWFSVVGEGPGSHAMTTLALMRSVVNPTFCIGRGNEEERGDKMYIVGNSRLTVRECEGPNPQTMYFEFELIQ
jgi:hypothetical protein